MRGTLGIAALLLLAACLPEGPGEEVATRTATFELVDGAPRYLDLSTGPSDADGWDLRADGWDLFLNGGESGDGRAGGIDMELLDLTMPFEELGRKNQILYFFFFDSYACALSDWWWYALDGTHTLFSNYHVFVVRRGDRDFAVQVMDYYQVIDGSAEAGYPEIRWAEIPTDGSEPDVWIEEIDATAGGLGAAADDPANQWAYFSFDEGVVDLSDAQSLDDDRWDLGFKRFNIKSSSGPSGPSGVVTWDFDIDRGEQADDVLTFTADTELPRMLQRVQDWVPEADVAFEEDSVRPVVRRWYTGAPATDQTPTLDPDRWFLVSDRTGLGLAKLRVIDVVGDDPAGPESITLEWALLE
jgi:hypothetical protein